MPLVVGRLSPSPVAVGALETIRGIGFFLPQLVVAHHARRTPYRKPLYLLAGATRAISLFALGLALFWETLLHRPDILLAVVFLLWSAFCVSVGAAQVPYTDVFARVVPARQRSRLLGGRGLVGGLLGVAAGFTVRHRLSATGGTVASFGGILIAGAVVFAASTAAFALVREPPAPGQHSPERFRTFLADNLLTLRRDRRFRIFLLSQVLDTIALAALPFYIVQVSRTASLPDADVGFLLAANTVGAVGLNPLWGWWGDRHGKLALLRLVAPLALIAPLAAIALGLLPPPPDVWMTRGVYLAIFFVNGACTSGRIVGDLGYLMEISPDHRRPEYSGYLNTWLAPIRLLPVVVAFLEPWISLVGIFYLAALAAAGRIASLGVLRRIEAGIQAI